MMANKKKKVIRKKDRKVTKFKSQFENEEPIDKADLIVSELPKYSNKKLLVTALALQKKSKNKVYKKKEREGMLIIARYITQILQSRPVA